LLLNVDDLITVRPVSKPFHRLRGESVGYPRPLISGQLDRKRRMVSVVEG
jgi:hypothetical protein